MRASILPVFFLYLGLLTMGCSDNSSVTFTDSGEETQGDVSEGNDSIEAQDGEDESEEGDATDEACSSKEECTGEAGPCETFACVEGACVLQSMEAGSACEDGDLCTDGTTCDEEGACVGGTAVEVVSGPCETCACDPEEGLQCFPSAVGTPCSDEDCCTLDDVCGECDPEVDENCSSSGRQCVSGEGKDCNDSNGCTVDQCTCGADDEAVCEWSNVADNLPCDYSENDCTIGDYCSAGVCIVGTPAPLDDGNPCTEDSCVKGEITHAPMLSGQCDDGNECTTGDTCKLGTCVGGDPVVCVIPNCASDSVCIQGEGCVVQEISWMPEGAACDDGNSCTEGDQCTGDGNCEGQANSCDDFNPCTTDLCDADGGCTNEPNPEMEGMVCAEATSDCSSVSVCLSGACIAQSGNEDCDDGNECTTDECVDGEGCVFTAKADGSPCDDGNPCTEDECSQGGCISAGLGGTSGGETVTCNQSNPLDPEGTCCCFSDDPTGEYKSGHVLDMGFQTSGTALECCIAPGLNSGCSDTAYISVSETGAVWDLVTSFATSSAKKPDGGWESICVTIEPGVDYQYVRGANDNCYVDFFSCTPSCGGTSCEPVDGGWSAPVFGECSEPCGGGTKTGISTCTSPAPECGGASCSGSGVTTESCNTQACEEGLVIGKNIFDEGESLHDLVIPVGVGSMTVSAWGAGGGGGFPGVGGGGAYVTAIYQVIPGDQLTVMVAGGGAKGGGGGASLVLLNGEDKVIAGGGGGAGSDGSSGNTTPALASSGGGAAAVGDTAQAGSAYTKYDIVLTGGQGGGPAGGGAGGTIVDNSVYSGCVSAGIAGKAFAGGAGAQGTNCTPGNPASFQIGGQASQNGGSGGGGSGYFGGGSGAQKNTYVGSGGGGGSSYLAPDNLTSSSEGASVNMPGGMSSPDYQGIVGQGGKDGLGFSQPGPGQDGLVIIELNP